MNTTVSMTTSKTKWSVYRTSGGRLEFVDIVDALDEAEAARKAVDKHHDWRSDGLEWDGVVIPTGSIRKVTVTYRPEAVAS